MTLNALHCNIQLLDDAVHDIENYSDRAIVICRSEAGADNNDEV